jgi:predicted nuclease of predicted toxin-antitoxin system
MKFLANENVASASVGLLRQKGLDVLHVAEDLPGERDADILELARQQDRIVITFDRDYGELVFKLKHPRPPGVIYLRFDPLWPTEAGEILAGLVGVVPLKGRFTVVERNRLRQRPLPSD